MSAIRLHDHHERYGWRQGTCKNNFHVTSLRFALGEYYLCPTAIGPNLLLRLAVWLIQ